MLIRLTYWGRDEMDTISQTIFSIAFSWIELFKFHWIFPYGLINNMPTLVQMMAWRLPGNKPWFELIMVNLPTHRRIILPQRVNSDLDVLISIPTIACTFPLSIHPLVHMCVFFNLSPCKHLYFLYKAYTHIISVVMPFLCNCDPFRYGISMVVVFFQMFICGDNKSCYGL